MPELDLREGPSQAPPKETLAPPKETLQNRRSDRKRYGRPGPLYSAIPYPERNATRSGREAHAAMTRRPPARRRLSTLRDGTPFNPQTAAVEANTTMPQASIRLAEWWGVRLPQKRRLKHDSNASNELVSPATKAPSAANQSQCGPPRTRPSSEGPENVRLPVIFVSLAYATTRFNYPLPVRYNLPLAAKPRRPRPIWSSFTMQPAEKTDRWQTLEHS